MAIPDVSAVEDGTGPMLRFDPLPGVEAATAGLPALFGSVIDTLPLGFALLDTRQRFVLVNRRLAEMNGVDAPAHIGRTVAEIVPPLADQAARVVAQILATGKPVLDHEFTGEAARGTGGIRQWSESWCPIRSEAGEITHIAVTVEDITEQKAAGEALAAGEAHHAFLVRLGDALLQIDDPVEAQAVAAHLLGVEFGADRVGYAEDEGDGEHVLITRNYTDGVAGIEGRYRYIDYGPALVAQLRAGLTVARPDIANDVSLTDAEKAAHARLQLGATLNVPLVKSGRLVAILFVHFRAAHSFTAHEVTLAEETARRTWAAFEQAKAQARLRESQKLLRAAHDTFRHLVKNSPFGVYVVDADFRLVEVSAGAQKVFENVRPLLGRDFAEVLRIVWPERAAAQFIERFRHTLATGEPYHAPRTVERRNDVDQVDAYDWKVERLVLPDGRHGVVCHFYDLSERRRYEARLEEADRRKDEFLAMLSHELRNPLAPIRNALEILRIAGPRPETIAHTRAMIERQVTHLTRLVDDLLDVSRVTQGKIKLARTGLDVTQVVSAGVELARPLVDAKGHRLELRLPAPGDVWVEGDATRLAQIVGNLLNNAAKYTDAHGRIEVNLAREGPFACLTVSDTGIGIEAELLPHVFEVFTQAERALDRTQGGLGIGLALVKQLVALHGGTVEAFSDGIGKGSRFTVRLPLGQPPTAIERSAADGGPVMPRRVLVVDDSTDAAESVGALLELQGHRVSYAHSGPAALERARDLEPDVCLIDIGLPGMDGYAVAARMRAMPALARARLVALSGYAPPENRREVARAGFDEYLIKPVEPATLFAVIAGGARRDRDGSLPR